MPKTPQVSIKGETYAKLKAHCEEHDVPIGKFVDELCQSFFQDKPVCDFEQKRASDFVKKPKV